MEILSAKVAILEFDPIKEEEKEKQTLFHKLTVEGDFYNDILRLTRINATIIPKAGIGHCRWFNGSSHCDNIFEALSSGEADLSLFPVANENYENYELYSHLKQGPLVYEPDKIFLSTPQVPARVVEVHASNIFKKFPLLLVILNLFILIIINRIINYRLKKNSNRRMNFLETICFHTLRLSKTMYHKTARRIVVGFTLFYCIFLHYFIAGQISSDLIISFPASYVETLEEVVSSNRPPYIFHELTVEYDFMNSNDPNKKILLQRAQDWGTIMHLGPTEFMEIASKLTMGAIVFCESPRLARNLKTMAALPAVNGIIKTPKVKTSAPFAEGFAGYMYSRNILPELKRRMDLVIQRLVETGHYIRLNTWVVDQLKGTLSLSDKDINALIRTVDEMERKEERPKVTVGLTLKHLDFFFFCLLLGLFLAFVTLLVEVFRDKREKNKQNNQN